MFQTLLGESPIPSPTSSPWVRLYPQLGFSAAKRRISCPVWARSGARPGRLPPYVHRRRTRSRCQRSSVAGCTRKRPPPRLRQQLAERSKQHTIGRPQARPPHLAPQHLQLMPQHQDLKLLRPLRTTKKNQQLEQTASYPVSEGHSLKQQTSDTHRPTLPARTTRV